jgi:hypothetical protein
MTYGKNIQCQYQWAIYILVLELLARGVCQWVYLEKNRNFARKRVRVSPLSISNKNRNTAYI